MRSWVTYRRGAVAVRGRASTLFAWAAGFVLAACERPVTAPPSGGLTPPERPTSYLAPAGSCASLSGLANTGAEAAGALQDCILQAPWGGVVEIPPGHYTLAYAVWIEKPLTLRTAGKVESQEPCNYPDNTTGCAVLAARSDFPADRPSGDSRNFGHRAILMIDGDAAGTAIDHLVIDGNRSARLGSIAYSHCRDLLDARWGANLRSFVAGLRFTNNVSQHALCGSGAVLEYRGAPLPGFFVYRNTFARNGEHDRNVFADGLTVGHLRESQITDNEFYDNTDVDFVIGGCDNCQIYRNRVRHSESYVHGSFAGLQFGGTGAPNDFPGTDVADNVVDCGVRRRCGFGILLGSAPWTPWDQSVRVPAGGSFHNNVVRKAEVGLIVNDAQGAALWANDVQLNSPRSFTWSGTRDGRRYVIGPRSSVSTGGQSFFPEDWRGVLPNHWDNADITYPNRYCTLDRGNTTTDGAVVYAYCLVMDRRTDPDGRAHYTSFLDQGFLTKREMILDQYRSPEFQNRFRPNTLNNADFVHFAYNLLLLRDADPDGYGTYTRALDNGWITREGLLHDIMNSLEYRWTNPPLAE